MDELWAAEGAVTCLHPGHPPLHDRPAIMASWAQIFQGSPGIHPLYTPYTPLTRLLQALLPLLCPFAGVPASQMTLGGKDCIATFFERIFHQTVIATDNYFYHAYLYGKYTRTNCPRYLRPEHFDALKGAPTHTHVYVLTCV